MCIRDRYICVCVCVCIYIYIYIYISLNFVPNGFTDFRLLPFSFNYLSAFMINFGLQLYNFFPFPSPGRMWRMPCSACCVWMVRRWGRKPLSGLPLVLWEALRCFAWLRCSFRKTSNKLWRKTAGKGGFISLLISANLRHLPTLSQFQSNLKPFLFTQTFLQI